MVKKKNFKGTAWNLFHYQRLTCFLQSAGYQVDSISYIPIIYYMAITKEKHRIYDYIIIYIYIYPINYPIMAITSHEFISEIPGRNGRERQRRLPASCSFRNLESSDSAMESNQSNPPKRIKKIGKQLITILDDSSRC